MFSLIHLFRKLKKQESSRKVSYFTKTKNGQKPKQNAVSGGWDGGLVKKLDSLGKEGEQRTFNSLN